MSLEHLVCSYTASAEHAFKIMAVSETSVNVGVNNTKEILNLAKTYLEDAKYYTDKNRFDVALTSIAYCEGLLDALRLLGAVKFEWPARKKKTEK
jgi:hypothetical protein